MDKIAGKRRERERESPLAGRLRASLGKERERERERDSSAAAAAAAAALSFLCVLCTPKCPEEGKFGGGCEREEEGTIVFKERRLCDSLFWCTSSKIES